MEVSLPGSVGAARKAVGRGKVYKADKHGAWAVGRATSVSEAYTVCVQCTYVGGSLP
jgi:hypothetical protein